MFRRSSDDRGWAKARPLALGLALALALAGLGPRAAADYPPQTSFGSCVLHVPWRAVIDRYGMVKASITGDCAADEQSQAYWQVNGSPENGRAVLVGGKAVAWVNPARLDKVRRLTFTRAGAWLGDTKSAFCPTVQPDEDPYPTSHPEAISDRGHPLYLRHRTPVLASCVTRLQQNQPQLTAVRIDRARPAAAPPQAVSRTRPMTGNPSHTTARSTGVAPDPTSGDLCRLEVPARVVISRPNTVLPAKISGPCATTGGLAYWFTNPENENGRFATAAKYLDGAYIDINDDIDTTDWPMVWKGFGAWTSQARLEAHNCGDAGAPPVDPPRSESGAAGSPSDTSTPGPLAEAPMQKLPECTDMQQTEPVTDIRLATAAKIAVRRSGGSVVLGASTQMYNAQFNHRFGPAGMEGQFQYREHGGTTWLTLAQVTTRLPNGTIQITYPTSRIRDYRFVIIEPRSYYAQSVSAVVTA